VTKLLSAAGLAAICLALPSTSAYAQSAAPAVAAATQYKYLETPAGRKPRVVITADPELDDNNSMIRYVLMADGYQTEGLIYTSSQFHWSGDGTGKMWSVPGREYNRNGLNLCPCTSWRWNPKERFIDDILDAYEKAYPNLRIHSKGYPAPAELRSKVKWGNIQFDGEMDKDTDGSNWIKSLLLDNINEPIYLHAWGGQSTIARALKSIEDQYRNTPQWASVRAKVIGKAVIHPSGDQDDTGAKYIRPNWPEIRYGNGGGATASLAYAAQANAAEVDKVFYSADWMQQNISSKGAFGSMERVWGDGKQMVAGDKFEYMGESGKTADQLRAEGYIVWTPPRAKGEFLGEGDTGTFLSLLDNGLEGWRQENRRNPIVIQTAGATNIVPFGGGAPPAGAGGLGPAGARAAGAPRGAGAPSAPGAGPGAGGRGAGPRPPSRFLAPLMHEVAERMTWALTPKYADANHYPTVTLKSAKRSGKPGDVVSLAATTKDPDGNKAIVKWWRFENNGTYAGAVTLDTTEGPTTSVRIPADAKPGDTIHIIAEATDDGKLSLTRYARAVVTVE